MREGRRAGGWGVTTAGLRGKEASGARREVGAAADGEGRRGRREQKLMLLCQHLVRTHTHARRLPPFLLPAQSRGRAGEGAPGGRRRRGGGPGAPAGSGWAPKPAAPRYAPPHARRLSGGGASRGADPTRDDQPAGAGGRRGGAAWRQEPHRAGRWLVPSLISRSARPHAAARPCGASASGTYPGSR